MTLRVRPPYGATAPRASDHVPAVSARIQARAGVRLGSRRLIGRRDGRTVWCRSDQAITTAFIAWAWEVTGRDALGATGSRETDRRSG